MKETIASPFSLSLIPFRFIEDERLCAEAVLHFGSYAKVLAVLISLPKAYARILV